MKTQDAVYYGGLIAGMILGAWLLRGVLPVAHLDIPSAIRYIRAPSHPSNGWHV
jgi:hypothetical protein